jgi:hypothetical protein
MYIMCPKDRDTPWENIGENVSSYIACRTHVFPHVHHVPQEQGHTLRTPWEHSDQNLRTFAALTRHCIRDVAVVHYLKAWFVCVRVREIVCVCVPFVFSYVHT